jgi:2-dehydro-3-deoxyphosphooctonate aldolase (KDO 8-P synthase)
MLTERGTSFGYNNLVTDMRSIPAMQKLNCPVVIDATHSVQLPGGRGTSTGGEREYAGTIALSGIAAGADGLFLEVHPEPSKAPCDPDNMLPLSELEELISKALAVYDAVRQ